MKTFDWRNLGELNEEIWGTGLAPHTEAHIAMMHWWSKLGVMDKADFKKAVDTLGGQKNWKWRASIPLSVWTALLEQEPWIMQDRKALYKWLDRNPQYKVPA